MALTVEPWGDAAQLVDIMDVRRVGDRRFDSVAKKKRTKDKKMDEFKRREKKKCPSTF